MTNPHGHGLPPVEAADIERPLGTSWHSYDRHCVPADASTLHRIEARRAYYGGAQAMLTLLHHIADLPLPLRAEVMNTLQGELAIFNATLGHPL